MAEARGLQKVAGRDGKPRRAVYGFITGAAGMHSPRASVGRFPIPHGINVIDSLI
jgi:hypothetical protein